MIVPGFMRLILLSTFAEDNIAKHAVSTQVGEQSGLAMRNLPDRSTYIWVKFRINGNDDLVRCFAFKSR